MDKVGVQVDFFTRGESLVSDSGKTIGSWNGRQAERVLILQNSCCDLNVLLERSREIKAIPRASSGSAPVYFPVNQPVVWKQTGEEKGAVRWNNMRIIQNICFQNRYEHLIIPAARLCGSFLIEERLPIIEFSQKGQVALYTENTQLFSSAVKEFTQLLCRVVYPDILTFIHPYKKDFDIPIARYDNIPFFLENGMGKIGLIDLEEVQLQKKDLSKKEVEEIAKKALFLFPYHFFEITTTLEELFPDLELDIDALQEEHSNIIRNFNSIYLDHINFILNKKESLKKPFISIKRKNEIIEVVLKSELFEKDFALEVLENLIKKIENTIQKPIPSSRSELAISRTAIIPIEEIIPPKLYNPSKHNVLLLKIFEELVEGLDICYANIYCKFSGAQCVIINF